MKKILALALACALTLGTTSVAVAAASPVNAPVAQDEVNEVAPAEIYLIPGTYASDGSIVENVIGSGATKLSAEDCAKIFTDNSYLCTLDEGAKLPVPSSDRTDREGNAYAFNGWWTITDATVTYYDTVPAADETLFLYADWRADLSQRKDPIIPDDDNVIEPDHYLSIVRAETGETERITMRKAFTNMMNAETLGYLYPVELFVQDLELHYGDVIYVYTTGLTDSETAVLSPVIDSSKKSTVQLESSGDGSNVTADYLQARNGTNRIDPCLTYIAEESGNYNIYIKYYNKGSIMAVYMEPVSV